MRRAELTERFSTSSARRAGGLKYICGEIGGMSLMLITGALLGQMKLTKPQAGKAAELFGLSKSGRPCSTVRYAPHCPAIL